jgi:hypothetical protein
MTYPGVMPIVDMQSGYAAVDNTVLGAANTALNIVGGTVNIAVDAVGAVGAVGERFAGEIQSASGALPGPGQAGGRGLGVAVLGASKLLSRVGDLNKITKGVPQIKPGAANGPTAGQVFPKSVKDAAKAENPTATCVYCQMEGTATQVDHAIPRVRGGDATLENAQLACPHCNASKGASNFPKTPPSDYVGPWPPEHW